MDTRDYKISENAIKVFYVSRFIGFTILTIIIVGAFVFIPKFQAKSLVFSIVGGLQALNFVYCLYYPKLKYKNWSFTVDEHKLSLRFGIFVIKEVAIPVKRIQYVDISQGPILRRYNLYELGLNTAGGKFIIPALNKDIAEELKNEVSARVEEMIENGRA